MCNDSHPRCIAEERKCDGNIDCKDGSDESDCCELLVHAVYDSSLVAAISTAGDTDCHVGFGYIRCPYNGRCIPSEWRCDGNNDCVNGSDEVNCCELCIKYSLVTNMKYLSD